MSKHHIHRPVKIDGEHFAEGIIELDDEVAAPLIESGHLRLAPEELEATVDAPAKKPAAAKKAGK
jgi:hypothetical protein